MHNKSRLEAGCAPPVLFATAPSDDSLFHMIVDAVEDYAIYMLDPFGYVVSWNKGAQRNKGYSSNEIIGQHYSRFFQPEDVAAGLPDHGLLEAARCGHFAAEGWRVRKDGTRFWAFVALNAMKDDKGQLIGYAKVTRDLTERRDHEEKLRASAEALQQERDRLRTMIQSMKDGVISVDNTGRVVLMNPVAELLTGFSAEQAWKQPVAEVLKLADADTGDLLANPARLTFEANEPLGLQNQVALLARDGTRRDVRVANAQIRSSKGDLTGAIITFHDISALRAALREIEFSARHDPLTRLANRREFERKLEKSLREVAERNTEAALCLIDLDHFKAVNDTAGHLAGDSLLREVGTMLTGGVRRRDLVARLGGDEFAIILNNSSLEEAELVAEAIRARLAAFEFRWEEHDFRISASIGIAKLTLECDLASLVKRADECCYAAKRGGKNRIEVCRLDEMNQVGAVEQSV